MSLPFLKVSPEEAVAKIQDMILAGYQLKDAVNIEHEQARIAGGSAIVDAAPTWSQSFNSWINDLSRSLVIFTSRKFTLSIFAMPA